MADIDITNRERLCKFLFICLSHKYLFWSDNTGDRSEQLNQINELTALREATAQVPYYRHRSS